MLRGSFVSRPASRRISTGAVVAAFALMLGACSSSAPAEPTTTQQVDSTTTSSIAPSTTAAPTTTSTTTTTLPITADPEKLLTAVNETMAAQTTFLVAGTIDLDEVLEDSAETFSNSSFRGGQDAAGNHWIDAHIAFAAENFEKSFDIESREVDGVTYDQEADSGDWEVEEPTSEFRAIDAALDGEIVLADTTAEESESGYRITGTVPADPSVEIVILDVRASDLALQRITVRTEEPRDEFDGLIGAGDTTVFQTEVWEISDYGADVATVAAPTEGLSTTSAVTMNGPFSIQIPNDWEEATPREKAEIGLADADVWATADGILFMIRVEDLDESGFGAITLDEYVSATIAFAISEDAQLAEPEKTTTVQALPSVILTGTADETSLVPFTRFFYLHDETIGLSITVVGPKASFEEVDELVMFLLNTFLVDDPPLVPNG